MKLTQMLADLELAYETELLQMFPGDQQESYRAKIREAFKRGEHHYFHVYLPTLVGDETAMQIRKAFLAGDL